MLMTVEIPKWLLDELARRLQPGYYGDFTVKIKDGVIQVSEERRIIRLNDEYFVPENVEYEIVDKT